MRFLIYFNLLFIAVYAQNSPSVIVSSTQFNQDISSNKLFDIFEDNHNDVLIIASTFGAEEGSDLPLAKSTFHLLNLETFVSFSDNCLLLKENIQKLYDNTHFKIIHSVDAISLIRSGIVLYKPRVDAQTLIEFAALVTALRNDRKVTFFITECQLFTPDSNSALGETSKAIIKDEVITKIVENIRATPVIVQQLIVFLIFLSILFFGLVCTLDVKTPSILLNPPQVHRKKA